MIFDVDEDFLEHYGVKGMQWGVRNNKQSSKPKLTDAQRKAALSDNKPLFKLPPPPNLSPAQKAEALKKNKQAFAAKFGETPPKDDPRFSKKQIATVALGAAVVGGLLYANRKGANFPAGGEISSKNFLKQITASQHRSWNGTGYIKESSLQLADFDLPTGHIFNRLTTGLETSFLDATYATISDSDFDRYVVGFGKELATKNLSHVTFSANSPIRVASTASALDVLGNLMRKTTPSLTSDEIVRAYENISGSGWNTHFDKEFVKELGKKGYDAVVDEMDAGVIGNAPVVVFAKEKFGSKTQVRLSASDLQQSAKSLIELTYRK